MSLKIRLARAGSKKRPYYHIVIADVRAPRDGRFIETVGAWNPMLPKDGDRVKLDADRIQHWIGHGAQPTDRVLRFSIRLALPSATRAATLKRVFRARRLRNALPWPSRPKKTRRQRLPLKLKLQRPLKKPPRPLPKHLLKKLLPASKLYRIARLQNGWLTAARFCFCACKERTRL